MKIKESAFRDTRNLSKNLEPIRPTRFSREWIEHRRLIKTGDKRPPKQKPGSVLLSHLVSNAVPSALEGLASMVGMGTGVSRHMCSHAVDVSQPSFHARNGNGCFPSTIATGKETRRCWNQSRAACSPPSLLAELCLKPLSRNLTPRLLHQVLKSHAGKLVRLKPKHSPEFCHHRCGTTPGSKVQLSYGCIPTVKGSCFVVNQQESTSLFSLKTLGIQNTALYPASVSS